MKRDMAETENKKQVPQRLSNRVVDFRMKQGKEEIKGRLIIISGTLYKLTITYPPSHVNKVQDDLFLDSFEVS